VKTVARVETFDHQRVVEFHCVFQQCLRAHMCASILLLQHRVAVARSVVRQCRATHELLQTFPNMKMRCKKT